MSLSSFTRKTRKECKPFNVPEFFVVHGRFDYRSYLKADTPHELTVIRKLTAARIDRVKGRFVKPIFTFNDDNDSKLPKSGTLSISEFHEYCSSVNPLFVYKTVEDMSADFFDVLV